MENVIFSIYKITNNINNKMYVGQTIRSIKNRFQAHVNDASSKKQLTYPLLRAIKKYGKNSFSIEVLELCKSLETTNSEEKFWIKELRTMVPNGYNLTAGGDGIGSPSLATRRKMAKSRLGKIPWNKGLTRLTDTRIQRPKTAFYKGMIPWNKGLTKDIDERVMIYSLKNVGKCRIPRKMSNETKQKISKTVTEYWRNKKS